MGAGPFPRSPFKQIPEGTALDQSPLIELLGSRKIMYSFLRQIFLEGPTEEVLGSVRRLLDSRRPEEPDDDEIPGLDLIRQAISGSKDEEIPAGGGKLPTGGGDEQLRDDLTREFNRLFIGPGRVPASPYESVYRSPSRLLMQESTVDVRRTYLEAGLVMQRLGTVPDDHLGAELEFMFYLADRAVAEAVESRWEEVGRYLDLGRTFLKEHLLSWVGEFSAGVLGATGDKFFRGLMTLLAEFLAQDLEFLQEVSPKDTGGSACPVYSASAALM